MAKLALVLGSSSAWALLSTKFQSVYNQEALAKLWGTRLADRFTKCNVTLLNEARSFCTVLNVDTFLIQVKQEMWSNLHEWDGGSVNYYKFGKRKERNPDR